MCLVTRASCLVICISICILHFAFCNLAFANYTTAYLGNGVGARAMGLGNTFVSVADDATAVYWNPAGLSSQPESKMNLTYQNDVFGYQNLYFFGALPTTMGKFGFGLMSNQTSSIYGVSTPNEGERPAYSSTLSDSAMTGFVSYASVFRRGLHWGVTGKYMTRTLASTRASGLAVDVGTMYYIMSGVQVGFQVRDLWSTGIQWQNTTSNPKDAIEPTFCGGLSWQGESFLVSFSDELGGSIGLGGEYNLNKAIAVRSGLQIPKDLPLRYWVGTSLDVANFRLDYVFQIDSNADMVSGLEHTLSVAFKI